MSKTQRSTVLTYDEIDLHIRRGRELRAEAIRGFFRSLFSRVKTAEKSGYVPRVVNGGA